MNHKGVERFDRYSSDSDSSYSSEGGSSISSDDEDDKDNYGVWVYGPQAVKIDKIKNGFDKKKLMNFFVKGIISYVISHLISKYFRL